MIWASLKIRISLINEFVPEFRVGALAITICPLSYALGCVSVGYIGGFGSSGFDVKLLGVDGSSDGFGWSFDFFLSMMAVSLPR